MKSTTSGSISGSRLASNSHIPHIWGLGPKRLIYLGSVRHRPSSCDHIGRHAAVLGPEPFFASRPLAGPEP